MSYSNHPHSQAQPPFQGDRAHASARSGTGASPGLRMPRGNPLTHSVNFTDARGTCWLVYVEPAPPEPALWPNAAVIPGRRLRFDSVEPSVMASPFPAGAPFLPERTLQTLLDQAQFGVRASRLRRQHRPRRPAPARSSPGHRRGHHPSCRNPEVATANPFATSSPAWCQRTERLGPTSSPAWYSRWHWFSFVIRDMILPRRG